MSDDKFGEFFDGYVTCALWTGVWGEDPDSLVYDLDPALLSIETRAEMHEDCADFYIDNYEDILEFANFKVSSDGSTPFECAGHDFWLTRNGHGAGFWDRGLGDLGTRLAMSARAYGSQTLMLGHDGKIYN